MLNRILRRKKPEYSLGICIPVWNRGDVFVVAFESLLKQLEGITATIWIYDNGSDKATRDIIYNIPDHPVHTIIKTYFPENMGIPYVANLFAQSIQEHCDYTGYHPPQYTLLMDSDAYYKKPVKDLIEIIENYYDVGVVSGHDSIEHLPLAETEFTIGDGKKIRAKEKENERMITMLMRREEYLSNYPFPHYRNRDVDWEITQWNPNSVTRRKRKIVVAVGYVLHLGINISTWNASKESFESEEEVNEVKAILDAYYANKQKVQ
jgi:glycosyltransferase involved in cell wall biosynthesis